MSDAPLHLLEQRVYYEHTDAAGVVYHANYLKFYEMTRTEWLRSEGFDHVRMRKEFGLVFAVRSAELGFHKPAMLDDLLHVSIDSAVRGRRASVLFDQSVRRDGTLISTAKVTVVCIRMNDGSPRSVRIPREIADKIPFQEPPPK